MTLNRWHATWFEIAKKAASSFSLVLLTAIALASLDYPSIKARLDKTTLLSQKKTILREVAAKRDADVDLQSELDRLVEAWDSGSPWSPESAIEMIELRAIVKGPSSNDSARSAKAQAAEIKKDPLYSDPGIEESSNWFSRAMQRFGELVARWFERLGRRNVDPGSVPQVDGGAISAIAVILKLVVFTVLAVLLGLFMYFVARHFQWKAKLHRKASAMLEEDEPERTLDEWLAQADKLIGEGKYREAVRCLYLACLLKFDEANVARFIRSQTNWEHLARIERSAKLPEGMEFREPTQAFDRIWYGFRINGMEDVSRFRQWYTDICDRLQGGPR